MKVLLDTNIVLDVLLDRNPFAEHAAYLMSKVENAEVQGYLCATTITTIHYLMTRALGAAKASESLHTLVTLFAIAPVNRIVIEEALDANFKDFEDAVLDQAALHAGVEFIITRNLKDFKNSKVSALTPIDFLAILSSTQAKSDL